MQFLAILIHRKDKSMNDIEMSIKEQKSNGKIFDTLLEKLSKIDDPRIERGKLHPLQSILSIYLCATVCNRTGWDEVVDFAKSRETFFSGMLHLPNGIPSADTFARVIERIHPKMLQTVLLEWLECHQEKKVIQEKDEDQLKQISLDGKTLRSSYGSDEADKACHIVHAWAGEQNVIVAQEAVAEKTNEITAMKTIVDNIVLNGSIVSIDAIGCQVELAESIIDKKGDYLFALKGNQKTSLDIVTGSFDKNFSDLINTSNNYHKTIEKDHGRIDTREYFTMSAPAELKQKWPGLKTIGMVVSQRYIKGKTSKEVRYYLTSRAFTAEIFGQKVRKHWSVENSLHWVLDVNFGEDKCRIRSGFAAQNVSWFRCLAISLLKREPTRLSIHRKMLAAGDNLTYLKKVLFNTVC